MAESLLALAPVNSQGGAILTFLFPMLLFAVVGTILWGLFAGWDWPLSRRFRPASIHHFQASIAQAHPGVAAPRASAEARAESPAATGPAESGTAEAERPGGAASEPPADAGASDGTQ